MASIDERCSYCGAVTAYGQHALWEAKQRSEAEARERAAQARTRLDRQVERASAWSWKGIFVLGLTGLYHGLSALGTARKHQLELPAKGKLGLAAGAVQFVLGSGVLATTFQHHLDNQARLEEIRVALGTVQSATLSAGTACLLLEQRLRSLPGIGMFAEATCSGPFEQQGQRALLEGIEVGGLGFSTEVEACLVQRSTWELAGWGPQVACVLTPPAVASTGAVRAPVKPTPVKPKPPAPVRSVERVTIGAPPKRRTEAPAASTPRVQAPKDRRQ